MKCFWIFILVSFAYAADAQHKYQTIFGLKGGLNHSIVNGTDLGRNKISYLGYEVYASFFADTELSGKWSLENEVLFSYTKNYRFIEIPMRLKYKINYKPIDKFSVLFGPKLDFVADYDDDHFESGHKFRRFGVSAEIGTQYKISKWLFAELRFSKGLTSQIDDFSIKTFDGKRNTIRLGVGVRF